MSSNSVVLVVEDSEQDFQDVKAYVEAASVLLDLEEGRDYTIDRRTTRQAAEEALTEYEQAGNRLIAIFDIHMEEQHEDLTELISALVNEPPTTWRGTIKMIVYSQYADSLDQQLQEHAASKRSMKDKRANGVFHTVSKSLRSKEDPREQLRDAISSTLRNAFKA